MLDDVRDFNYTSFTSSLSRFGFVSIIGRHEKISFDDVFGPLVLTGNGNLN